MYKSRKATDADYFEILQAANASFRTVRDNEFDFEYIMPKVYRKGRNMSGIHTVLEKDGKIVSLVGNLPSEIVIGENRYPFTVIGTVSTLPEHRGNGYMSALMNDALKETERDGYIFSTLTGKRARYNHFGFEKCTTLYRFDFERDGLADTDGIILSDFDGTDETLNRLFEIFLATRPYVTRTKENFTDCLKISGSDITVVRAHGKICGYASFCRRKNCVQEINLTDYSRLYGVVQQLMYLNGLTQISVMVNPLERDKIAAFDAVSEQKSLCDNLHLRVYDVAKFLEMLLSLNAEALREVECREVYSIDGQALSLTVGDGIKVEKISARCDKQYSQAEFLRAALGDGDDELCRRSQIFPLRFGINEPDMF